MQWLANICVRRPVFASVLMLVILVLGVVGYSRLGVDQFPSFDIPIVVITTTMEGASPEEMELDVTDKIEGAVNTISGVDELISNSSEGVSQVIVNFTLEKNLEAAINEVRDKINLASKDLPRGVEPPVITKVDPGAAPVLLVGLRGKGQPVRELTELSDKKVRRQLETIDGVGKVTVIGGRDRQINILMNPLILRAQNITTVDVLRALQSQNLATPGGALETGPRSLTLRIDGRVTSIDAIRRLAIRADNERILRIGDVAKVVDSEREVESLARYDGDEMVVLSIVKQGGTNTIQVVDAIDKRMAAIRKSLPPGVDLVVVRDNSQSIRTAVHAVTEHLILGAVLAALVVLMFIGNARSTIIAAVSIPVSIIGTFGLMYMQDYTLNNITLLALALAVGIVIDDAIVVLENIIRFIEEKNVKPFPAAVLATKEIGLAVMATTLSLMAVFVPVAFVGGVPGRFLKSFGYTMAFAVGVSLLVSFSLTPMMSARMLRVMNRSWLTRMVDFFYKPIERAYMRMLHFSLRKRWVIMVACALALGSCIPVGGSLPGSFMPQDDKAKFQITIRAPEGTSSEETLLIAERAAVDLKKLPGVAHLLITVAEDDQKSRNFAQIYVELVDPGARQVTQFELMTRARTEVVDKLPSNLRVTVAEVPDINWGAAPQAVQLVLTGPDSEQLEVYAGNITKALKDTKTGVDVDTSSLPGRPEVKVSIDRDRAADLGVSVSDIAQTLQMLVAGLKGSTYPEGGEEYDIRLRAEEQYRSDPSVLALMNVPSSKYGTVPLTSVVKMSDGLSAARINRYGRERQVTLLANPAPGVGESQVSDFINSTFEKLNPLPNYRLQAIGRARTQDETGKGFMLAMGMGFLFMYLILAAQFESWLYPFIILSSLPLTVPFALISLKIFGQSLNLFSMLGLLVLFGVVKKNSILQVDHTNYLRRLGRNRFDALMEANRDRLRPILMTTIAFVAGMAPLIFSKGIGSGFNRATSSIVIGGQTLSLLLTLLAVPVIYSLVDDLREWRTSKSPRAVLDQGQEDLEAMASDQTTEHTIETMPAE
jgi:HAE1 family hydrophobic/amphiphilic exporter-1